MSLPLEHMYTIPKKNFRISGKCNNYDTKEECLSSMPGVKCVWSEEHKCLLKEDAEERMTQKVINAGSLSVAECQEHDAGK